MLEGRREGGSVHVRFTGQEVFLGARYGPRISPLELSQPVVANRASSRWCRLGQLWIYKARCTPQRYPERFEIVSDAVLNNLGFGLVLWVD